MRKREQKDVYEYAMICKNIYRRDRQGSQKLVGGDCKVASETCVASAIAASIAYARVPNSKEHILLLGDTKIRSDAELMLNFGLSGYDADNPDPATVKTI